MQPGKSARRLTSQNSPKKCLSHFLPFCHCQSVKHTGTSVDTQYVNIWGVPLKVYWLCHIWQTKAIIHNITKTKIFRKPNLPFLHICLRRWARKNYIKFATILSLRFRVFYKSVENVTAHLVIYWLNRSSWQMNTIAPPMSWNQIDSASPDNNPFRQFTINTPLSVIHFPLSTIYNPQFTIQELQKMKDAEEAARAWAEAVGWASASLLLLLSFSMLLLLSSLLLSSF